MIIVLLFLLVLLMIVFFYKIRTMLSFWLLIAYIGCFLTVVGYMYYFAKTGGFSKELQGFLFLNGYILKRITYAPISLDQINGYIVFGRSMFLFSVMCFSIEVYMNRRLLLNKLYFGLAAIIPLINIVLYNPDIYKDYLHVYTKAINAYTRVVIVLYLLMSIGLIIIKYNQINIPWIKRQLLYILFEVISIEVIFFLFGFFGTLQVIDLNELDYLYSAFGILHSSDSIVYWYGIVAVAVVFTFFGYVSLWNYAKVEKQIGKPDLHLERKIKTAHMGARVFTHGIKNQLLVSRVILKRLLKQLEMEELDKDKLIETVLEANRINENTLQRMDVLYQAFKTNAMSLKPLEIKTVIDEAINKTTSYDTDIDVIIETLDNQMVLADAHHLSEAIYNIIINGIDAIKAKKDATIGVVRVSCLKESKKILIVVEDNGIGISEKDRSIIFDPFYTNKNTNFNWGVGLSHAQQIIDSHFGYIRIESQVNRGTKFLIVLPVYQLRHKKADGVVL